MISILLVDDEVSVIKIGTAILERFGYNVVSKRQGMEALHLFRKNPHGFDLVITDYAMPGMKGDELAAEIRLIRKDIPLILCTGHTAISESCLRNWGFDAILLKPFRFREMARIVDRNIKREKKRSEGGLANTSRLF
ncbi:MAG: response regulator [Desulfobacterales bacterium]|nr:response regulator [Desulfobacterales bacterium]